MRRSVLLVDDEPEILELLTLFLEKEQFHIVTAQNGLEAWNYVRTRTFDLVVLDIMMPKLDGLQLLKLLRQDYKLPVILLSAKSDDSNKILGLGLGADDFIAKPFNPLEVVARILAMLRRTYEFNEPQAAKPIVEPTIEIGSLKLVGSDCALYKEGRAIQLTAMEYRILKAFMEAPGRIFTKKQLFEQVWSDFYQEDANTIMVHISRLRDKIEDQPKEPVYIKTIRGLGYRFAKREEFK